MLVIGVCVCGLFCFYIEEDGKMIKINGEKVNADGKNISDILADMGYSEKRVAVELNKQIVPKAKYDATVVYDGDNLEIVRFVGGG